MRFIRKGHRVFLALGAWVLVATGCGGRASDSPSEVVGGLYCILLDSQVTGAPTAGQLAAMEPHLSAELLDLLQAAGALRDSEATARPDEKPPFVEGDLFSSLFEGPTGMAILADAQGAATSRVVMQFSDDRVNPAISWTDTVVVTEEDGRLVIADVVYGGTWDFANRGSLLETLRVGLDATTPTAWTLRLDGIGPVRVGMTIAEVEQLLGATARIDRIEPDDECGHATVSGVPEGISFMLSRDTVVRANVHDAGILDELGLGVGSSEAEVLARRGATARVEPHHYTGPEGHYVIVDNPARPGFRLIYETDGQRVLSIRAGRLPEAEFVEGCA